MTDIATEIVDRLGVGLEALWSLVYAAQEGALSLAVVQPGDEGLRLTDAGALLGEALEELEAGGPLGSAAVSLGAPGEGLAAEVAGLLLAAIGLVRELAADDRLEIWQLLALSRVVHLAQRARQLVTGTEV